MLVRYSVLADASGSFGGLVASHNRAGQYLRTRVRPTNPSSARQVAVRIIFANLATAWRTLSEDQREAWSTYAINVPVTNAFGEPLTLTGHQMYVRCNSPRMQAGLSRVDDGPTIFAMAAFTPGLLNPNAGAQAIEVFFLDTDDWANELGGAMLVYSSRQVSPTINYFNGTYRLAGPIVGGAPPPAPAVDGVIPSPFALTDGNSIFARILVVRADGRLSPVQLIGPELIVTT